MLGGVVGMADWGALRGLTGALNGTFRIAAHLYPVLCTPMQWRSNKVLTVTSKHKGKCHLREIEA